MWELSIKFDLLWWGQCRDLDLWCPNSRGKCGDLTSGKARGAREQALIAGENEKVCVKVHRSFFSVHEIDHPSNISMNRTVEQLAQNSAKKKEPFKELK